MIVDKVTGEILNPSEAWKSDIGKYKDVKAPVINRYVADKAVVNGKVIPNAPTPTI